MRVKRWRRCQSFGLSPSRPKVFGDSPCKPPIFLVSARTSPLFPQPWLIASIVREGRRIDRFHAKQNPSLGFRCLIEKMFFRYFGIILRLQR
jgi:hypothetical protein